VLIKRDHLANVTSLEHERGSGRILEFCRKTALIGQARMATVIGARASPICSIAARTAMSTVSTSRAL